MASKFCPQCGNPTGPNARFCESCGTALGESQPSPPPLRPNSLPETPKPSSQPPPSPPRDPRAKPTSLPESGGKSSAPVGVGWRPASGSISPAMPSAGKPSDSPGISVPLFSKTKIVGYVRGLSQRMAQMGQQSTQIYSFRVETFDAQGNRQTPVTIEMKGQGFEGSLNEGDQVEIDHKPRPGKAIKIKKLMNLTSGAVFKVQDFPLYVRILSFPVTLMGWIITAAFVIGFFWLLFAIISDLL